MNTPSKIALVGAGGIGCVLAPLLCRESELVICDEDNYEPSNHGRQFPSLLSTDNKAKVLAELIQKQTFKRVSHISKYVKNISIVNNEEWEGVDMIIGGVDNNKSRHILFDLARDLSIPAILGGNSHAHGEAYIFIPNIFDPRESFAFPNTDPTPWSCNSDKELEEYPQTAIANIMAASAVMHIMLSWREAGDPKNVLAYSRLDPFSSDYHRVKELLAMKTILE